MEKEKIGFFKRMAISIKDFEKYDIFASETFKNSIKYLFTIILIFSIICTIVYSYKILNGGLAELVNQVENEVNEELGINTEEMQSIMEENYEIFFIVLFFTILIIYFCSTFIDAAMLGILGLIIARIVRIRMKYTSTFNIGIYSLTLPIILQVIYIAVNILTGFEVKYFQWMYSTISYIYVLVAILMIKTQYINQQKELIKIQIVQKEVREEMQNQDEEEKRKENEDDKKEKEDKNEKQEDNNVGEAPEGTNA